MRESQLLYTQWNVDGNGKKVSLPIQNESYRVVNDKILLNQIPDELFKVVITGMDEIRKDKSINLSTQYKVDYDNGLVYFHQSKEGSFITISMYYGRGMVYIDKSRIATETNGLDVTQTLADIIEAGAAIIPDLVEFANGLNNISNIKGKPIDITGLSDNNTLRFDAIQDKWVVVAQNIDRTPPSGVSFFNAVAGTSKVDLSWGNPSNIDFAGVKILRQTGTYPTSVTDGTVVYTGANTSYSDTTVINNTTYYYRIFTFDTNNNYNTTLTNQQVMSTPITTYIYGVKIDTTNSNSSTALVYTDDAVGLSAASGGDGTFSYGGWIDKFPFNLIKPCMYKDGVVNYYLKPDDYSKKSDNSLAVTGGGDGDVMIEFPKIYWYIYKSGTDLYVKISNIKIDSNYKPLAHMRGSTEYDKCYIGAYLGWYDGTSKLRSLTGKPPTTAQTIGAFRTQAKANGSKYDQIAYYQLLMLQVLYIIMFKNLNAQAALGKGYTNLSNSTITNTGSKNTAGMFWGNNNDTSGSNVKFCGIEDFYGNVTPWVDGFYYNASRNILIANQSFVDNASGYSNFGSGGTADASGYISDVIGNTECGFFMKGNTGSATTYYADHSTLIADRIPVFGGNYSATDSTGPFRLQVNYTTSGAYNGIGARLMALG